MKKVTDTQETIDYSEYGYEPGTKMEIDSELYTQLGEIIQIIGQKESMIAFEQRDTIEATFAADNQAKPVLTPTGIKALSISLVLNNLHVENVKKGIAKHRTELEKPKISLAE